MEFIFFEIQKFMEFSIFGHLFYTYNVYGKLIKLIYYSPAPPPCAATPLPPRRRRIPVHIHGTRPSRPRASTARPFDPKISTSPPLAHIPRASLLHRYAARGGAEAAQRTAQQVLVRHTTRKQTTCDTMGERASGHAWSARVMAIDNARPSV